MAKVIVSNKVQKDNSRKFKIKKDKATEIDADIEILEDGDYEVDKLSVDGLPSTMEDGTAITWFNNFAIKKNGQYINQSYKITIAGISALRPSKKLVLIDGNTNNGKPYVFTGDITNDTFELTDGDPAVGGSPP